MRVVVDTNLLVSAALRDRDPERLVAYIVGTPGVEWIATPAIVDEYRGVIRRPEFAFSATMLSEWDRLIDATVLVIEPPPLVEWSGDPGDAIFVACALAADADF